MQHDENELKTYQSSKIDDPKSFRMNKSVRGLEVKRELFRCKHCGHRKAFKKRIGFQCTRCKKV